MNSESVSVSSLHQWYLAYSMFGRCRQLAVCSCLGGVHSIWCTLEMVCYTKFAIAVSVYVSLSCRLFLLLIRKCDRFYDSFAYRIDSLSRGIIADFCVAFTSVMEIFPSIRKMHVFWNPSIILLFSLYRHNEALLRTPSILELFSLHQNIVQFSGPSLMQFCTSLQE